MAALREVQPWQGTERYRRASLFINKINGPIAGKFFDEDDSLKIVIKAYNETDSRILDIEAIAGNVRRAGHGPVAQEILHSAHDEYTRSLRRIIVCVDIAGRKLELIKTAQNAITERGADEDIQAVLIQNLTNTFRWEDQLGFDRLLYYAVV